MRLRSLYLCCSPVCRSVCWCHDCYPSPACLRLHRTAASFLIIPVVLMGGAVVQLMNPRRQAEARRREETPLGSVRANTKGLRGNTEGSGVEEIKSKIMF